MGVDLFLEHLNFTRRNLKEIDWLLVGCILALTLIGFIVIDGSKYPGESDTPGGESLLISRAAFKQLLFAGVSLLAFAGVLAFDYKLYEKIAWPLYIACNLSLILLLVIDRTRDIKIKGAASWFDLSGIGLPLRIQPSEFTKIAVVLVLARWLSRRPGKVKRLHDLFLPLAIVALPLLLIVKQPDLGTALVFVPVGFVLLWTAGIRKRYVVAAALLAVLMVAAVYPHLKPHQKERITVFINPGSDTQSGGYNIAQAEIALGSGRLFGKGWRRGTQTAYQFLPEHHTDFIFSSLVEQFGFVGATIAILLYALVIGRALRLAKSAKDWFGGFLIIGLTTIIAAHVVLNIGMNLRIFPVAGLPLPFLSYGGSFLLTNFILCGLIVNVGMRKYFFE